MFKNNLGQVAYAILFLAGMGLVTIAILSFYGVSDGQSDISLDLSNSYSELNLYRNVIDRMANLALKEAISCGSCSVSDVRSEFRKILIDNEILYPEIGNFFGKIRTDDFSLEERNGKYVLEVKDLFIKSSSKFVDLRQNFDISVEI